MNRWIEPTLPTPPADFAGIHPLVARILIRRGKTTYAAARAFLNPNHYSPTPASQLTGMEQAAARVSRAIQQKESICIWGDFDVDGQTSTALLVQALTALGANVTYHIPVRERESHGVNIPYLKEIIDNGAQFIVTCDTGISANEAVEYASSRGVEVVITDHHDLGETLPAAAAITNPKLLQPEHPLATLAGVGVAYKLAEALFELHPAPFPTSDLLDLVALGLVADLALLRGDTRYLVQRGLEQLRNTKRTGLQVLMEMAELNPTNITEGHIGFGIGPRLNALGRLGDANPAVELLTTSDIARARVLAAQLEGLNAQRKLLCDQVTQAAEAQLRTDPSLLAQPIIILGHESWPGGVIGIVAARMVERYHKPAILFSTPADGIARGSARSIDGLHITEAIAAQQDMLRNFGGHPMAAGLGLETERLPEFRRRMAKTVEQMLATAQVEESTLEIDGWLGLDEISIEMAEAVEQLAPFGPGNEKLVLATRNLTLDGAAPIGRSGEHVRLTVSDEHGNTQPVLWWGGGSEELPMGQFDLAYTIRTSDYKGQRQVNVELVDFRNTGAKPVEIKNPEKRAVIDCREEQKPKDRLAAIRAQGEIQVWAEGKLKKTVNGLGRHELSRAEELVIWGSPPSQEVLSAVLETVQPQTVYLFANDPAADDVPAFLARLAGLVKFVLNQRSGRSSLEELSAACAQTGQATRLGLEWLSKRGQVSVSFDARGEISLAASPTPADESAAARLESQLRTLLKESAAYRSYFASAQNPLQQKEQR